MVIKMKMKKKDLKRLLAQTDPHGCAWQIVAKACEEAGVMPPQVAFAADTFVMFRLLPEPYRKDYTPRLVSSMLRMESEWRGKSHYPTQIGEAHALAAAVREIPGVVDAHFRAVERQLQGAADPSNPNT